MSIDHYVRSVEQWTAGPRRTKAARGRELRDHLEAAAEHGDLEAAMARLGSPRDAARTFAETAEVPLASLGRRAVAALVDLSIFALPTYAGYLLSAPTSRVVVIGSTGGPGLSEIPPEVLLAQSGQGSFRFAFITLLVLAMCWYALGLPLLEARYGRTPGKALLGIRARSEDGIGLSQGQAFVRRLPFIFGGLQWLDAIFVFFGDKRQRAFDRVAHTIVTRDVDPGRAPRLRWLALPILLLVIFPAVAAAAVFPEARDRCLTAPVPVEVARTRGTTSIGTWWNFPGLWDETKVGWGCTYSFSDGSSSRLSPGGEQR